MGLFVAEPHNETFHPFIDKAGSPQGCPDRGSPLLNAQHEGTEGCAGPQWGWAPFLSPPVRAGTPPLSERDQEGGQERTRGAPFKCKKSHARDGEGFTLDSYRPCRSVSMARQGLPSCPWCSPPPSPRGLTCDGHSRAAVFFLYVQQGVLCYKRKWDRRTTKPTKPGNSHISSNLWGLVNYRISIQWTVTPF